MLISHYSKIKDTRLIYQSLYIYKQLKFDIENKSPLITSKTEITYIHLIYICNLCTENSDEINQRRPK